MTTFELIYDGSSPQVRGKRMIEQRLNTFLRLIPAGAGKTIPLSALALRTPAHPRRCGENPMRTGLPDSYFGSSPQVRGKRRDNIRPILASRLIPAGAGKTHKDSPGARRSPAHPRRCGENDVHVSYVDVVCGSSPQVRGKRLERRREHL